MQFVWIFILIYLGLMFFMTSNSQKKQRQKVYDFQNSLAAGDKIVLTSGIYGTIRELDETTAQVEIAPGVVIKVDRYNINRKDEPVVTLEETVNAPEELLEETAEQPAAEEQSEQQ